MRASNPLERLLSGVYDPVLEQLVVFNSVISGLAVDALASYLAFEFVQVVHEDDDHLGIEEGAAPILEQGYRFLTAHRFAVLAVFSDRVEAVGDGQNPSGDWDLVALQAVGITSAVPSFVMVSDHRHNRIREADSLQYLRAYDGVHLHLVEFGGRQSAGFVENIVGHRELAYVVHQSARPQRLDFGLGQTEEASQPSGVNLDPPDVLVRNLVFRVNGYRQRFYRSEVKIGHLLGVLNRGLDFVQVDLIGQIRRSQNRYGNYEGVELNDGDKLDDDAGGQRSCKVG